MYWYIVAAVIAIGVGVKYSVDHNDPWEEGDGFMLGAILLLPLGAVATIIGMLLGADVPRAGKIANSYKLAAFRDSVETNGRFFLGSGSIEGKLVYRYYIDNGNGSYSASSLNPTASSSPAMDVVIFEDSTPDTAYLEMIREESAPHSKWKLAPSDQTQHWRFHVPKGTVVQNFKADLGVTTQ
jgi:hypothetical protein